jgi:predicted transcriptional regulator YdeE
MNIVEIESIKIVGISVRTTNADEMNEGTAKIPDMWEEFYSQFLNQQVQGQIIYGVYSEYEADVNGKYTVTAGVEQTGKHTGTGKLSEVKIEAGKYMVFEGKGDISTIVVETWGKVWRFFSSKKAPYLRKYTTDFEKYISSNQVEIYIAVNQII